MSHPVYLTDGIITIFTQSVGFIGGMEQHEWRIARAAQAETFRFGTPSPWYTSILVVQTDRYGAIDTLGRLAHRPLDGSGQRLWPMNSASRHRYGRCDPTASSSSEAAFGDLLGMIGLLPVADIQSALLAS
jgi:hypothetical protein